MSTIKKRPMNGVSYGLKYTITADDVSTGYVEFDYRKNSVDFRYNLTASVQILNSSGVLTMPVDTAITYPSKGIIRVTATLIENSIINLIAQPIQN